MKKARIQPLVLLTCMFAAGMVGLFIGRNMNRAPVQIQSLPAASVSSVSASPTTQAEDETPQIMNINTATAQQLQTLPNIGPKTAEKIIAYRKEHGAFESVSELINVSGIGEKTLESIWDLVTTGG